METLVLKIERDILIKENTLKTKIISRNAAIDRKKEAKRAKDKEAVAIAEGFIAKCEEDIKQLNAALDELAEERKKQIATLGKLRLSNYVFADIIYGYLVEYKLFLKTYCINTDAKVLTALERAIESFSSLPFELGDGGNPNANKVFDIVSERYLAKWEEARDAMMLEVLRETDEELNPKKYKLRNEVK